MSAVDWQRFNELRTDIGEEDFADVAMLFVAELLEHLDRLGAAPQNANAADFHFLRGSAANLGLVALVSACSTAEVACNDGNAPDIDAVRAAFENAIAEIRPQMPEIVAA